MPILKLTSQIKDGSVTFSVSELTSADSQQSCISISSLRDLYKKRYKLNGLRTFDKSVMGKEFGQ
jgi:hypothetical protein